MDAHATTDEIRRLLRGGDTGRARRLLDDALSRDPHHPEHRYLRGMLHAAAGENLDALADFDAAIALQPDIPPVLFNRGLTLFRLERSGDALADFNALARIEPDNADAWTNIGIIHSREGRPVEAIAAFEHALALRPRSPLILRALANALRDTGRHRESLRLHERVATLSPADPAAMTDRALCLLSLGEHRQARALYERALSLDPGDQTALAGIYMTSNELGDRATAGRLMDYRALLGHGALHADDGIDLAALREAIVGHRHLVWEPAGRSTMAGKQSPMLDLSAESPFAPFERMIARQVERRIAALADAPGLRDHPWLASMPRRWRLQSWITVLEEGGQQTPHIHPAGWLSGVFYVDAGAPRTEHAGDLVFGRMQPDLALDHPADEHHHRPVDGQLITFPSYFFHNTVPYSGTGPRISLAFDVVPQ